MRAVIWQGPRKMEVGVSAVPQPAMKELLVKIHSVGICGSELSGYLGESSLRVPPLIMGHEFSGTVAAVGSEVTRFKEGDAVAVNPLISCGTCVDCRSGLENLCRERKIIGVHMPGAFAEFVVVLESNAILIAKDPSSLLLNSLAEPMACSVRAVKAGFVGSESRVLVLGAGTIGLFSVVAVQRAGGVVVLVSDTNPGRLDIAKAWGAARTCNPVEEDVVALTRNLTDGLGVDVVIDAVGNTETRQTAIQAVRSGGKVVWIGLHTPDTTIPANYIVRNEIAITGSFAYTKVDFQQAVDILAEGRVKPDATWLDERPLDDCGGAFNQLVGGQVDIAKIILHP